MITGATKAYAAQRLRFFQTVIQRSTVGASQLRGLSSVLHDNTFTIDMATSGRRRRPLSTPSSSRPNNNNCINYTDMVATTQRLLDLTPGSFSTYTWRDGQEALDYWMNHQQQQQQQQTLQQANHGRALLGRLIQERQGLRRRMEAAHGSMVAASMVEQCYPLDAESYKIFNVGEESFNDDSQSVLGGSNNNIRRQERLTSSQYELWETQMSEKVAQAKINLQEEKKNSLDFVSELRRMSQQLQRKKPKQHPTNKLRAEVPIVGKDSDDGTLAEAGKRQPQQAIFDSDDHSLLVEDMLANFEKDWSTAGLSRIDAQNRVEQFRIHELKDPKASNEQSDIQKVFLFALQAWEEGSKRKPKIAAQHADKLLYEMLTLYLNQDSNQSIKPCRQCFLATLKAHTISRDPGGADRILQDMIHLYEKTGDKEFRPDRQFFLAVLMSYFQRKRDADMVYKADLILHRMLDLAECSENMALVPPDSLVQHIVALWAESYEQNAGERAEAVLLRMRDFRDGEQWPHGKPPLKFFELIMENWANSGSHKSVERVEKIQNFARQVFADNEGGAKTIPPSFGYLPLLRALARKKGGKAEPHVIDKMETIFREYQSHFGTDDVSDLDIILAYKARMMAYDLYCGSSRKAAVRSQTAFYELMRLRRDEKITRDPDATTYGILANAWAKAGEVTKVKQIMQEMSKNLKDTRPNIVMYNYLLLALSRCKDPTASVQAEELLTQLEEMSETDPALAPNVRTYGVVLATLANSSDPEASAKAGAYLQKLKDSYAATGNDNLKPNTKIYTNTMQALVKSKDPTAPEKSRALLDEMTLLAQNGDNSAKPDVVTFTTMLQVLKRAKVPGKAKKAAEIISLMKEAGVEADSFMEAEARRLKSM